MEKGETKKAGVAMPGDLYSRSLYYKNLYEKEQKPKRIPRQVKWLILAFSILAVAAFFLVTYMNSTERLVRKYLSEKYPGQEFVIVSISGMSYGSLWNSTDKHIVCYPKGGDPETDKFKVKTYIPVDENGNEGEREFRDNYFAILIREDVEADVLNTLSDMNLPMKVYYKEDAYYGLDYDSTHTYVDLKKDNLDGKNSKRFDIGIYLLCKDIENREQYAQQIFDLLLSKDGIAESVDLYIVTDETIYSEITRKNRYDLINADGETIFNLYKWTNY